METLRPLRSRKLSYQICCMQHTDPFLLGGYYICLGNVVNPAKHRFAATGLTTFPGQILCDQAGKDLYAPLALPFQSNAIWRCFLLQHIQVSPYTYCLFGVKTWYGCLNTIYIASCLVIVFSCDFPYRYHF